MVKSAHYYNRIFLALTIPFLFLVVLLKANSIQAAPIIHDGPIPNSGNKFAGITGDVLGADSTTPYENVNSDVNISGETHIDGGPLGIGDKSDGTLSSSTTTNVLKFGGDSTGEGITSKRGGINGINLYGLEFYTDSADRLSILNNGNTGIGTVTPASLFSVGASSQFQVDLNGNLIKINNVSYSWPGIQGAANTVLTNNSGTLTWATPSGGTTITGTPNYVSKFNATGNNVINSQIFDNGTNVGIGTTNPNQKLEINGGIRVEGVLETTVSSGNILQQWDVAWSNDSYILNTGWAATPGDYVRLGHGGNGAVGNYLEVNQEKGVVIPTGNVGISTTNPGQKLTVEGTLGILGGSYHTILQGGAQTGDITYTLPVGIGTSGQVLTTDGTGILSWTAGSAGSLWTTSGNDIKPTNSGDVIPGTVPSGSTGTTAVDGTGFNAGQGTAVAVGLDGFARIAYYDITNSAIKFTQCTNAACTTKTGPVTLAAFSGTNYYISMKLGKTADTNPRIAYTSGGNIMFVQCTAADCSTKAATSPIILDGIGGTNPYNANYASLDLTSANLPMIAYMGGPVNGTAGGLNLMLARCSTADCSAKSLDTVDPHVFAGDDNRGTLPSVAVGSDNLARIVYIVDGFGTGQNFLTYARCTGAGGSCSTGGNVTINGLLASGYTFSIVAYNDIKLSVGNLARISYTLGAGILYLECLQDVCSSATNNKTTITTGETVTYNSIALGTDGFPRITYYESTGKDLKLVKCGDTTCTTSTNVITYGDTLNDVGKYPSIGLDSSNGVMISYYDVTNTNLKLVYNIFGTGKNLGSPNSYWNSVYAFNYFGKTTNLSSFDIAEDYPTTDSDMEAGDLVMIDPRATSTFALVTKSKGAYEAKLVGAVSTNPGVRLGDWQKTSTLPTHPIALVGQTPVKVSLENGPIQPGDLLTSSSTPGVAMKATKAGIIIGKALEPYSSKNIDKISVFINTSWFDPNSAETQAKINQMADEINALKQEVQLLKSPK